MREPYAQVVNIGTNNDGHTKEGITFPSAEAQGQLARQVNLLGRSASCKALPCSSDVGELAGLVE